MLEDADPAPPAKGINRWTVALLDSQGVNAGGAGKELEVVPFMPDHDHGPARVPIVDHTGSRFTIDGIDFFMPGLWRVTLTALATDATDTAEFFFCIEG